MERDEWLTAADAGRELGISAGGARWLADTGRLAVAARTRSGLRLFRRADVERYRAEKQQKQVAPSADGGDVA